MTPNYENDSVIDKTLFGQEIRTTVASGRVTSTSNYIAPRSGNTILSKYRTQFLKTVIEGIRE